MERFKLDKVLDTGTLYRAERDKAYVIKAAGTNVTDKVTLSVSGIPSLEIRNELASIDITSANVSGLLDLKDNFVVVPPDKVFRFDSPVAGKVRIKGEIIELSPGETLPTDLMSRFTAQGRKFYTFNYATLSIGTSFSSGDERTVLNITTPVKEQLTFNHRIGFDIDNLPAANNIPGQIGIRFFLDDKPLDIVETAMGDLGIDIWGNRLPPTLTNNFEVGSLADRPIVLTEGRNLKVKFVNVGASITSSSAMVLKAMMVTERQLI
jgi:hypothetical protein